MTESDSYNEWLHEISHLNLDATLALPDWQQRIALVQQLAVDHLYDGAASLFYNNAARILPTVAALEAIGEIDISKLVLRILDILSPTLDANASDIQTTLVKQLHDGPAANLAQELDGLIEDRWNELHDKMKNLAEANDWSP